MREGGAPLNVYQVVQRRSALPLVDADRQVQGQRFTVHREEVGVVKGPVHLDAAKEDSARAVIPAEPELPDGRFDIA